MKKIDISIKFSLILCIISIISCQNPTTNSISLGVDNNSIQLGTIDPSGSFVLSKDKIFLSQDKIILKVKAIGLTIKASKIKANIDLFLRKDKDILGTQTDILGKEGFSQNVSGVDTNYLGSNGQADLNLTITPPSDTKGDLVANITLKDLNSDSKITTFETKFTLK